jgi:hexosaminidase
MRVSACAVVIALAACAPPDLDGARAARDALIPLPASLRSGGGWLAFDAHTPVTVDTDATLGDEAYTLAVGPSRVRITASGAAGAFYAHQTLAQLLPAGKTSGTLAEVTITDGPRFPWRGLMLDVARHFFPPGEVKRWIDLAARYKLNRVHLHLTDDQGWRLEIRSWPKLASSDGAFTQAEYAELVAYARDRFVTLVPEIDLPGHSQAARTAYPQLDCAGALCVGDASFGFFDDVVGELAALQPGGWLHVGGDESTQPDYAAWAVRAQQIVAAHGLRPIGWEEIAKAGPAVGAVQLWLGGLAPTSAPVIFSPATHAYLDMKYDAATPVGTSWVGYVEVDDAYDWDPDDYAFASALGVEAALWTETVATRGDGDLLMFPRLVGHAEIAWSPRAGRTVRDYLRRLATHGPRLDALGVGFYRSPLVAWPR